MIEVILYTRFLGIVKQKSRYIVESIFVVGGWCLAWERYLDELGVVEELIGLGRTKEPNNL